jgi:hypothetical protein
MRNETWLPPSSASHDLWLQQEFLARHLTIYQGLLTASLNLDLEKHSTSEIG